MAELLVNFKTMLDIEDDSQDAKLEWILKAVTGRLRLLLGLGDNEAVPDSMEHIIVEVSIVRFNRIGSEGMHSNSVEGETLTWNETNDFAPYMDEIEAYLESEANMGGRGKVKFI